MRRSWPCAASPGRARCSRATRASSRRSPGPFEIDWAREDLESVTAHHPQALQRRDPLAVGHRGAARAARRARADRRPRSSASSWTPSRSPSTSSAAARRATRSASLQGGSRPLAALPARPSRCWTVRCCPSSTCAERIAADDVQQLLQRVDGAPGPRAVAALPRRAQRTRAAASARRAHARARAARLPRLPHTADGLGRRGDEVRSARRRATSGHGCARRSPTRSNTSTTCRSTS